MGLGQSAAIRDRPRTYGEYITNSVFLLLTQSTLPREKNVANAAARMRYVPSIIEAAKANIRNPPKVVLETAIRQNKGAIAFYESGVYEAAGESPGVSSFKAAAQPAIAALKSYQEWLEKEALPKADGDWRLGKDRYFRKLDLELEGAFPADEVLAEAESEFARVQRDMYVVSRQLWSRYFPGQPLPPDDEAGRKTTIRKVIAKIGENHARPEDLIKEARESVTDVKAFIAKRDILRCRSRIAVRLSKCRSFSAATRPPI